MGLWESTVLSLNPTVGFRLDEATLTNGSTLAGNFDGLISSTITFTVTGSGTSVTGLVYNNSNAAICCANQSSKSLWLGPSTGQGSVPAPFNVTTNFRWHGFANPSSMNQVGCLIQVGETLNPNVGWELIQSDGTGLNPGSILTLMIPYPSKSISYPYYSVTGQYQILNGVPFEWFIDNNNGVWSFAVGDAVNGLQVLGQAEGLPITYTGGNLRLFFDNYPNWWSGTQDELLFWNTAQTAASRQLLFDASFLQAPQSPLIYIYTSNLQDSISIPVSPGTGTYSLIGYSLYEGSASGQESGTAIASLLGSSGSFPVQATAIAGSSKFYVAKSVDSQDNLSIASNEVSSTTTGSIALPNIIPTIALEGSSPAIRNLTVNQYASPTFQFTFTDISGNAVSLTGHTLAFVAGNIESNQSGEYVLSYTTVSSSGGGGSVIINGNVVTATFNESDTQSPEVGMNWWMWDTTEPNLNVVLVQGVLNIVPAILSSSFA